MRNIFLRDFVFDQNAKHSTEKPPYTTLPPNMPDQQQLSDEDKKILEEAHKNKDNPEHPAHKDHPKHGEFLKSIPEKLGGAAIFGAGATAGSDAVNKLIGG